MLKKSLALACMTAASLSYGEPQRAQLTHENKMPELYQLEAGVFADYSEYDDRDVRDVGPYFRFGLIKNLTLTARVPYRTIDPDLGQGSESGLGDGAVGVELVAYEDVFEYPYVIPHVEVGLTTGDEDEGLGTGESVTTAGISVGTVTHDCLHWIADFSYVINGGREVPDPDNIFLLGGSLIWDVSDQFSLFVEGNMTDEDNDDETPMFVQGGFDYDWTESFNTAFYFGAGRGGKGDEEGSASFKAAYTF